MGIQSPLEPPEEDPFPTQKVLCYGRTNEGSPLKNAAVFLENACSVVSCFQLFVAPTPDLKEPAILPVWEMFTSTLALDLLEGTLISPHVIHQLKDFLKPVPASANQFNFFQTNDRLPNDVDDTALRAMVLLRHRLISPAHYEGIVRGILANVNGAGVVQVYFAPRGVREGRICHAANCNVLRSAYLAGLGPLAEGTEDHIFKALESKAYLDGSKFYQNHPDSFLYFLARAMEHCSRAANRFRELLKANLGERLGLVDTPLSAAFRILAAESLGLLKDSEFGEGIAKNRQMLVDSQAADGSWREESVTETNRVKYRFGSKAFTTLFAFRALTATDGIRPFVNGNGDKNCVE